MRDQQPSGRRDGGPAPLRPFHLRGRFLTAVGLTVETENPDDSFFGALRDQLETAPHLLAEAPLVLDLAKVPGLTDTERLRALVAGLRDLRLSVFGIQNASEAQEAALVAEGLIPIRMAREAPDSALPKSAKERRAEGAQKLRGPENRVITGTVRSGQMIVAERGDLTIIGSVASGAEIVAAGNIHVYGTLRGRAMAGVQGDEAARIFCRGMEAELLAIAGLYKTSDAIGDALRGQAVQVYLDNDTLCMEAFA